MVKSQQRLHEEMEIMRLLDHPNIVRLYETFEDEKHVYMVVEICKGGELFEYIVPSVAKINEKIKIEMKMRNEQ